MSSIGTGRRTLRFGVGDRVECVAPVMPHDYGIGSTGVVLALNKPTERSSNWGYQIGWDDSCSNTSNHVFDDELKPGPPAPLVLPSYSDSEPDRDDTVAFPIEPTPEMLDLIFGHNTASARRNYDRLVEIAKSLQ